MISYQDDKDGSMVRVTIEPPPAVLERGQSSHHGISLSIPENATVQTFEDGGAGESLIRGTPASSPSIVRKLSTYLKSPIRSASQRLSTINLMPSNNGYHNVDDHGEELHELSQVDLSTLAGLGFEEHAMNDSPRFSPPAFTEQQTEYVRPQATTNNRPTFAQFREQRRLGRGLDDGIRLERAPSTNNEQSLSPEKLLQRAQTVRSIGQRVAQQRNQIVAVRETVDLSILEGTQIYRRDTAHIPDGLGTPRTNTLDQTPQSYYFPHANVPNWKPFSISSPFIFSLTILALSLAGLQEYLCQKSIIEERKESGILAFNQVAEITVADFFAWKYLPTMITIIYAVLFSIMDFDIRRLEPYYQLSQNTGSTAAASLNLDHLTMFQYLVPFNAVRLKQWAVAISTFGNIVAATVAPALQNPSFNFVENANCEQDKPCPGDAKKYFVRIDPVWSRLLTVSYILIAAITVVLLVLMRRKSGLLCDPKGIAGIASMATKSHILQDFRGLGVATRGQIHKRLAHRRFVLYQSSIWQGEWTRQGEPFQESDSRLKTPHPPMLRLTAAVPFIGYMVVCLVFVPLIGLTKLNVIPNKAPWAPILVATILKLLWSTFEADVRLMEPFYRLSKGNARPENSITLDYQATVYGIMPFVAVFKGHYLVALVGICSVLLDVLSVTAGSFSVSADIVLSSLKSSDGSDFSYDDETSVSFWTSMSLSIFILSFVIFTTILVYIRRSHPFLPREPSTIAAVLAFIYNSKMLDDFVDTEKLTSKELEKRLKAGNKLYGLGYYVGRDGKISCAIDQGEMVTRYSQKNPYTKATSGPLNHDFYAV